MIASTRRSDAASVTVLVGGAGVPGTSGIVRSLRAPPERDVDVDVDLEADGFGPVESEEGMVESEEGMVESERVAIDIEDGTAVEPSSCR